MNHGLHCAAQGLITKMTREQAAEKSCFRRIVGNLMCVTKAEPYPTVDYIALHGTRTPTNVAPARDPPKSYN